MPDYKTMYFELVGEVADAIDDLRALETSAARISMGLRRAMQRAENVYVDTAGARAELVCEPFDEVPDEAFAEPPAKVTTATGSMPDETAVAQSKAPVT